MTISRCPTNNRKSRRLSFLFKDMNSFPFEHAINLVKILKHLFEVTSVCCHRWSCFADTRQSVSQSVYQPGQEWNECHENGSGARFKTCTRGVYFCQYIFKISWRGAVREHQLPNRFRKCGHVCVIHSIANVLTCAHLFHLEKAICGISLLYVIFVVAFAGCGIFVWLFKMNQNWSVWLPWLHLVFNFVSMASRTWFTGKKIYSMPRPSAQSNKYIAKVIQNVKSSLSRKLCTIRLSRHAICVSAMIV